MILQPVEACDGFEGAGGNQRAATALSSTNGDCGTIHRAADQRASRAQDGNVANGHKKVIYISVVRRHVAGLTTGIRFRTAVRRPRMTLSRATLRELPL